MSTTDQVGSVPDPPYVAVIFTSQRPIGRTAVDTTAIETTAIETTAIETTGADDYDSVAERMIELAADQPGFLAVESARDADGFGITVSYWADDASIAAWHRRAEHRLAQARGYAEFYQRFTVRVARVERTYGFERS